jgi:hypothetical protein
MFWGPPETCSAKIWSQASGDDEFDRGYVTADDDYHWICEQCFAVPGSFKTRLNTVVTRTDSSKGLLVSQPRT